MLWVYMLVIGKLCHGECSNTTPLRNSIAGFRCTRKTEQTLLESTNLLLSRDYFFRLLFIAFCLIASTGPLIRGQIVVFL